MEEKPASEKIKSDLSGIIKKLSLKIDEINFPPFIKKNKLLISGIIITALIFFIFMQIFSSDQSDIPSFKVKREKFLVSITESGEIRAKNSISISSPRIRGNLKIVYLEPEGNYVQANDTVVRFDPTEALTNLKDAESKLEVALSEKAKLEASQKSLMTKLEMDLKGAGLSYELSKLKLEQIKFEAEIKQQEAKLEHERNELSFQKSRQEFESQKIVNQSELNKVNIEVQQKQADLARAKRDLEMLTLTAPTEGLVVYEVNWSTGRKIQVGDTPWGGMTIISLPDLSFMESFTYVNEVDVSRIKKGIKVQVKLDAFQDSTFDGEIASVASLGKNKDNKSNIKVFEIAVNIKSQSSILKPGMTTSNKMIINEVPDILFVPQEAVFESEGKKIVYLKNGSGFDETEIEVGEKSENYIVVTKGLEEGDEVALRNPNIKLDETEGKEDKVSPEIPTAVN